MNQFLYNLFIFPLKCGFEISFEWSYCWWKKSCTSWYVQYPIIYRVSYIPGGAGFQPSTVSPRIAKRRVCRRQVWSRKAEGRFPEAKELKQRVRDVLVPKPHRTVGWLPVSGGLESKVFSEVKDTGNLKEVVFFLFG